MTGRDACTARYRVDHDRPARHDGRGRVRRARANELSFMITGSSNTPTSRSPRDTKQDPTTDHSSNGRPEDHAS